MPPYRARALVLRKTKLGETDVIVTMVSSEGSQIRAVAKGMRKPGSRFGGRLEPFSVVDAMLHTGRSLDIVSEVESVGQHSALREDFDRSTAAYVIADVLDKLCCEGQIEDRLYGLGVATFDVMEIADVEAMEALVTGFLVKAMAMHGLRPELHNCAACSAVPEGGQRFSPADGGILCPACGKDSTASLPFDEAGRMMLLRFLGSTMEQIAAEPADPVVTGQCFTTMNAFVSYHIPARLKALEFFAGMRR